MSARQRILERLARVRAGAAPEPPAPPPERLGPPTDPDPRSWFIERARRLGSEVITLGRQDQAPAAVAGWLAERGLEPRGAVWPGLAHLPWRAAGLALDPRAAAGGDPVGITGAFAAIAETGTLMLLSGPATPASVSLLPETHVAILRQDRIVATMEQAFARMRARGPAPRAVNFVSGPSRTADVEQTITVGAHGPRRVLVVLTEE